MLTNIYIPRLSNDMKLVVWKNHFGGQILYRNFDISKKTASIFKILKNFELPLVIWPWHVISSITLLGHFGQFLKLRSLVFRRLSIGRVLINIRTDYLIISLFPNLIPRMASNRRLSTNLEKKIKEKMF